MRGPESEKGAFPLLRKRVGSCLPSIQALCTLASTTALNWNFDLTEDLAVKNQEKCCLIRDGKSFSG